MSTLFRDARRALLPGLALLVFGAEAAANTLNQNVSWTIDRAGSSTKYRVVAYGDSIYSGYNGSAFNAAKYSAPTVGAEYFSTLWNADIESVRRTKSGAVAADIYNNKIVAERSYMQASSTRVVTFEMCGNDGLQARSSFKSQTGTCNYSGMDTAVSNCKTYVARAMDYINANAYVGTQLKIVSNLYYPGYAADNVQSSCKDATSGATVNLQNTFLPRVATMNYWMCEYARQKGFQCADNFAQYMGADHDSNGDGQVDSDALRYVAGESEASYLTRITSTLRSTIRDANMHFVSSTSSFDYIQSDDTHRHTTAARYAARAARPLGGGPLHIAHEEPDLEPLRPRAHGPDARPPTRPLPDRKVAHGKPRTRPRGRTIRPRSGATVGGSSSQWGCRAASLLPGRSSVVRAAAAATRRSPAAFTKFQPPRPARRPLRRRPAAPALGSRRDAADLARTRSRWRPDA
jgi:lysophospholipase L1-like esterase